MWSSISFFLCSSFQVVPQGEIALLFMQESFNLKIPTYLPPAPQILVLIASFFFD